MVVSPDGENAKGYALAVVASMFMSCASLVASSQEEFN